MDGASLDDILNGTDPGDETPEVTETVEQPEAAQPQDTGQPRDEHGRFAPKGEKQPEESEAASAPPAPQIEETGHIPVAALTDERRKRQALEQEMADLRAQLQQIQQPQQPQVPQQQVIPDRWEDPDGYDRWLVSQAIEASQGAAMQAFQYQRIQTAAAQFKADKPDYDEAIQTFGLLVQQNPMLIQQMAQAPDPARYAYETAKTHQQIQQYGSVEALIAARVEAEKQKLLAQPPSGLPSAPPTLAAERNVGARSGPAWVGPSDLQSILGH